MARGGITKDEYDMGVEQIRWANSELLSLRHQISAMTIESYHLHKMCTDLKDEMIRLLVQEASVLEEKQPFLTKLLQAGKDAQERRNSEKKR